MKAMVRKALASAAASELLREIVRAAIARENKRRLYGYAGRAMPGARPAGLAGFGLRLQADKPKQA